MKKILTFLLILASFTLASCGSKKDDTKRIDQPTEALIDDLKLEAVKQGNSIGEVNKSKKEYYDIKMAANPIPTLFVYNSMLDSQIEKEGTSLRDAVIKPLVFTGKIYEEEAADICATVFDSKEGITKDDLGVSFDLMSRNTWTDTVEIDSAVDGYLNDGVRNNCISIVYLPLHVEHVDDNKSVLEVYVLMPVYYEVTTCTDGAIASQAFNGLPIKNLTFTEDNLLPSA